MRKRFRSKNLQPYIIAWRRERGRQWCRMGGIVGRNEIIIDLKQS